jgi:ribosome-associated heat shock protein Hsp15
MTEIETSIRLDKWLWAARFFKTRAIASHAISGGKVHLDGQRAKASRLVKINDCYEISRGQDRLQIIVLKLAQRRASATIAQTLYRETLPSIERREREAELRKLAAMQRPVRGTRPSKQERRKIHQFTRKT